MSSAVAAAASSSVTLRRHKRRRDSGLASAPSVPTAQDTEADVNFGSDNDAASEDDAVAVRAPTAYAAMIAHLKATGLEHGSVTDPSRPRSLIPELYRLDKCVGTGPYVLFSRRQFEIITKLGLDSARLKMSFGYHYGNMTFYPLSGHVVLDGDASLFGKRVVIKAVAMSTEVDIFKSTIYNGLWRAWNQAARAIAACTLKPSFVLFKTDISAPGVGLHWYNHDIEAMVNHPEGLSGGRVWHKPTARPYSEPVIKTVPELHTGSRYTVPSTYRVCIHDDTHGITVDVPITLRPDDIFKGEYEEGEQPRTLSDNIRLLDDMVKNYGAIIRVSQY